MISFHVLFGGFVVFLLYFLWTRRRYYHITWKIGGPIGYPLFGITHKLFDREKLLNLLLEYKKKYGRMFVAWSGPIPFLVISDPKTVHTILTSTDCVNKSLVYSVLIDGIGRGLMSSNNPDWNNHRKLLNPTFSHKVLLSFFPIFNLEANNLQVELNQFVGAGEVNIGQIFERRTLTIASQTTMGQVTNSTDQFMDLLDCYEWLSLFRNISKSINTILKTMTKMLTVPWLRYKVLLKMTNLYRPYTESKLKIGKFIQNQAKQRLSENEHELPKDNFEDNPGVTKNPKIFIDRAIDLFKSGEFTWREVEDESNQIVLGAYETTATTIRYTLILLSMFPKYQDRLYEEIKTITQSKDSNTDLTYEDVKQMTYMDMVINETMRVIPSVPVMSREVTKDVTLPNGIVVPKGMQIMIDIFNMHRDPEYWGSNSTTFNPDNFLPANMADKHPYTFIPFSKGLRNCIGWRYALISLKIMLSKILLKYRFTTKFDFQDLQFVVAIVVKLKKYPLLELHLREP